MVKCDFCLPDARCMCVYIYTIVCMKNDRERKNKATDGQSCEAMVCWNTSAVHGLEHHSSGNTQAAMVTLSEHFLNSFVCPTV